jgi:cytochrome b
MNFPVRWKSRQVATADDEVRPSSDTVVIWDGWVRGVHWLIAVLFAVSWYTHRANLEWHRYAGYALLTLVLFRIYWGFVGSTTARFAHFVKGPAAIFRYGRTVLGRGQSTPVGHNPLGAISVVLLLGLLLAQCLLGLFVTDVDGLESGPLSGLVSFDTSRTLAEWHGRLFTALQILVGIHVVAVLFYLFAKRENLIGPMVTGRKRFVETVAPLPIGKWWHAASALVVIALLVWLVVRNG